MIFGRGFDSRRLHHFYLMKFSFIYITVPDRKEARRLGRLLVENRLAACVNILDRMESLYWWKGRIEKGREVVLIAKTRKSLVRKLIRAVKAAHSYTCPCIVELAISSGYLPYLDWIKSETKGL
jgi:periplasmic divalent cation tolerance protein